jgi:hypothetical protein
MLVSQTDTAGLYTVKMECSDGIGTKEPAVTPVVQVRAEVRSWDRQALLERS